MDYDNQMLMTHCVRNFWKIRFSFASGYFYHISPYTAQVKRHKN